ncbi:MAG: hypothetical protein DRI57_22170, partial [Deltaproteobacteria bacterium]
TFENIAADHFISVTFEEIIIPYTVTATSGENGSIAPSGTVTVNAGAGQTFTMNPAPGYQVADVIVDGESAGPGNIYTFENVAADHFISVTFEKLLISYMITGASGENGSISPSGDVIVNEGESHTFTMLPADNYEVEDILADGESFGAADTYTFENIISDHTLSATFKLKQYTITALSGENGSITPSGDVVVNAGDSHTFEMLSVSGYKVEDVKIDGESVGAVSSHTFDDVNGNHTIDVSFTRSSTSPVIELISYQQRQDGTGYIDIEFIGKDAEGDAVSWYEPETYSTFTAGPDYDTDTPLVFVTDDPAHTAEEMTFTPSGTVYNVVADASSWSSGYYKVRLKVEDAQDNHSNYEYSDEFQIEQSSAVTFITDPGNDSVDVTTDTAITVKFSQEMDGSTIHEHTFIVNDGSEDILGTVTYSDATAIFTPAESLDYDSVYTAVITSEVRDLSGDALQADHKWSFTTASVPPDNHPPDTPVGISPGDEAVFEEGTAILRSGTFSDPDGDEHEKTQWFLRRADRANAFSESISIRDELTEHTVSGLEPGLKYFWKVRYEDSRGGISSWSREYALKMGHSVRDNAPRIDPGMTAADFEMISFVHWPDNPSAESVFGDDIGEYDTTIYRIGTYDPLSNRYVEYGNDLKIEPGKAYWFFARNSVSITIDGIPVSTGDDIDVEMRYRSDHRYGSWNMIACPNETEYIWDNVQVLQYNNDGTIRKGPMPISSQSNDLVDKKLWRWKKGTYTYYDSEGLYKNERYERDPDPYLKPYRGYWAKVRQENVFLRFPEKAEGGGQRTEDRGRQRTELSGQAAADSDEGPPTPIIGFAGEMNSGVEEKNGGGCFIAATESGSVGMSLTKLAMMLMLLAGAGLILKKRQ